MAKNPFFVETRSTWVRLRHAMAKQAQKNSGREKLPTSDVEEKKIRGRGGGAIGAARQTVAPSDSLSPAPPYALERATAAFPRFGRGLLSRRCSGSERTEQTMRGIVQSMRDWRGRTSVDSTGRR